MASGWFGIAAPVGYLAVLAIVFKAVRGQPGLTGAGSVARFGAAVTRSGGTTAARQGLYLDLSFIVAFLVGTPWGLAGVVGGLWWIVPVVAGSLDFAEDALALSMLRTTPTERACAALAGISAVKLAAYVVTWGVCVVVKLRSL